MHTCELNYCQCRERASKTQHDNGHEAVDTTDACLLWVKGNDVKGQTLTDIKDAAMWIYGGMGWHWSHTLNYLGALYFPPRFICLIHPSLLHPFKRPIGSLLTPSPSLANSVGPDLTSSKRSSCLRALDAFLGLFGHGDCFLRNSLQSIPPQRAH